MGTLKKKAQLFVMAGLAVLLFTLHDSTAYATPGGPGFAWCCGDWSSRIAWEANYALSQSNYVASDPYAYEKAAAEAGGVVGEVGPGKSGWCTFFVRLILYRSTYWAGYGQHLTTPGFPGSVYSWCSAPSMTQSYDLAKPGWVISSYNYHMGILYERVKKNGAWGWYVIDSNWVGSHQIGKHFMSDSKLKELSFWTWWPSWATAN